MTLPPWIDSLGRFHIWIEKLIDESGGYLVNDYLDVQTLGPFESSPVGLLFHNQRLRFWDGTFLEFTILIDAGLEQIDYKFHYQGRDQEFIWRKDKHEGHDEIGLTHIHDVPNDPAHCRPYPEVNLQEALEQVRRTQEE